MNLTIKVTNERQFKDAIDKLTPPKRVMRDAVEAGAQVVVEGEQRRVHRDTSNLHDSIGFDEVEFSGNTAWTMVGPSDDRAPIRDVSGYAAIEEYRVGGNAEGAPFGGPHAYVRPTADEDADDVSEAMAGVFRRFWK